MGDQRQLLKGVLEGCILYIISQGDNYGYSIIESLRDYGFQNIKEGTVYPLLMRLEKRGMLTAELVASDKGAARKYYAITETGLSELREFIEDWSALSAGVSALLGGKRDA